jgi:hypothetical protein
VGNGFGPSRAKGSKRILGLIPARPRAKHAPRLVEVGDARANHFHVPVRGHRMYNDPLDSIIRTSDQRIVRWIIELIRLFAVDRQQYKQIASAIATKYSYDERKTMGIQTGCLYLDHLKGYAQSEVLREQSISMSIGFNDALTAKLYNNKIAIDVNKLMPVARGDLNLFLVAENIKELTRCDCLDNAIMGMSYILDRYRDSVYHIVVEDIVENKGVEYGGTGFIVAARNRKFIITNKHVVCPERYRLKSITGSRQSIDVGSVVSSKSQDVAAVEVRNHVDVPSFWLQPTCEVLQNVVVMSFPQVAMVHPALMVHAGQINGFSDTINGQRLMFISANVSPGSSGGPVLNELGQVVGVTTQSQEGDYGSRGRSVHFAAVPSSCVDAAFKDCG